MRRIATPRRPSRSGKLLCCFHNESSELLAGVVGATCHSGPSFLALADFPGLLQTHLNTVQNYDILNVVQK